MTLMIVIVIVKIVGKISVKKHHADYNRMEMAIMINSNKHIFHDNGNNDDNANNIYNEGDDHEQL